MTRPPKQITHPFFARLLTWITLASVIGIAVQPWQIAWAKAEKQESSAATQAPADTNADLTKWWNQDINDTRILAPSVKVAPSSAAPQPSTFMQRSETDRDREVHKRQSELPMPVTRPVEPTPTQPKPTQNKPPLNTRLNTPVVKAEPTRTAAPPETEKPAIPASSSATTSTSSPEASKTAPSAQPSSQDAALQSQQQPKKESKPPKPKKQKHRKERSPKAAASKATPSEESASKPTTSVKMPAANLEKQSKPKHHNARAEKPPEQKPDQANPQPKAASQNGQSLLPSKAPEKRRHDKRSTGKQPLSQSKQADWMPESPVQTAPVKPNRATADKPPLESKPAAFQRPSKKELKRQRAEQKAAQHKAELQAQLEKIVQRQQALRDQEAARQRAALQAKPSQNSPASSPATSVATPEKPAPSEKPANTKQKSPRPKKNKREKHQPEPRKNVQPAPASLAPAKQSTPPVEPSLFSTTKHALDNAAGHQEHPLAAPLSADKQDKKSKKIKREKHKPAPRKPETKAAESKETRESSASTPMSAPVENKPISSQQSHKKQKSKREKHQSDVKKTDAHPPAEQATLPAEKSPATVTNPTPKPDQSGETAHTQPEGKKKREKKVKKEETKKLEPTIVVVMPASPPAPMGGVTDASPTKPNLHVDQHPVAPSTSKQEKPSRQKHQPATQEPGLAAQIQTSSGTKASDAEPRQKPESPATPESVTTPLTPAAPTAHNATPSPLMLKPPSESETAALQNVTPEPAQTTESTPPATPNTDNTPVNAPTQESASPAPAMDLPQQQTALYADMLAKWQASGKQKSFEHVLNQGQKAAAAILRALDTMDSEAFDALRKTMTGYLMLQDNVVVVAPDPDFFLDQVKQHGRAADIAFFELMSKTLNGYWPTTMEQRTDLSGCTRFGSGDLVKLYGDWISFQKRYPGAYQTALHDPNLPLLSDIEDQLLNSHAACDGPNSVVDELKLFIERYPRSPLTPKIKQRLQNLQRSQFDMTFYQGVKYNADR